MTPGQAAYEKWIEHVGSGLKSKMYEPIAMKPWGALPRGVRAIWADVAAAAIRANGKGKLR